MARRILNRKDLRADYEAAERRKADEEEQEEDEEEEEGEEAQAEDETGEEDEEAEEAPPKKRKAPAKTTKAKPRSRAAKHTRMKIVWVVFNNSNQKVATYDYPKKRDAEEHAARLTVEKKQTHFVQPVKEAMEEKKDE